MTLFGNGVFADQVEMRPYWIRLGLKANDWCPYEKREAQSHTRREQATLTAEAETGVVPAATRS